ncbi:hypothetical protein GCM10023320_46440 [Pseudonocardia adelaidensis]|uniref:Uncharacterized protein n=1 Tax=Pseudonocardia adelaidensis TaxID=648754 RepID=A0ABP9NNG0_9PSEU
MTALRRNVWVLGTEADPWHPVLRGCAHAIRAMQRRPLTDPRSWRYQAAIHGIANAATPGGAPWNQCQHASCGGVPAACPDPPARRAAGPGSRGAGPPNRPRARPGSTRRRSAPGPLPVSSAATCTCWAGWRWPT